MLRYTLTCLSIFAVCPYLAAQEVEFVVIEHPETAVVESPEHMTEAERGGMMFFEEQAANSVALAVDRIEPSPVDDYNGPILVNWHASLQNDDVVVSKYWTAHVHDRFGPGPRASRDACNALFAVAFRDRRVVTAVNALYREYGDPPLDYDVFTKLAVALYQANPAEIPGNFDLTEHLLAFVKGDRIVCNGDPRPMPADPDDGSD